MAKNPKRREKLLRVMIESGDSTLTISTTLEIKEKTEKFYFVPSNLLDLCATIPGAWDGLGPVAAVDGIETLGRLTLTEALSSACIIQFAQVWTKSPVYPKDGGATLWPPGPWENFT